MLRILEMKAHRDRPLTAFTLDPEEQEKLRWLAKRVGLSMSATVGRLIRRKALLDHGLGEVSAQVFELLEQRFSLRQIVIRLRVDPALVRRIREEYLDSFQQRDDLVQNDRLQRIHDQEIAKLEQEQTTKRSAKRPFKGLTYDDPRYGSKRNARRGSVGVGGSAGPVGSPSVPNAGSPLPTGKP
jgi:hypothetical protein